MSKGLEVTAYHPENLLGTALGYMVSSRGGDYVYASMEHRWSAEKAEAEFGSSLAVDRHSSEAKGELVRRAMLVNIALDSLGLCRVPSLTCIGDFDLIHEADLTAAITGIPITAEMLFEAADRVATLERLFNLRQGLFADQEMLPTIFFKEGQQKLTRDGMSRMLHEFYQVMGWDAFGRPTPDKLAALEIFVPVPLLHRQIKENEGAFIDVDGQVGPAGIGEHLPRGAIVRDCIRSQETPGRSVCYTRPIAWRCC